MNDLNSDLVVVGAGLAGLAAAITAAGKGARVTLLERASEPGGRAGTRTVRGFHFNLGPHALYPESRRLLQELGVRVAGGVPPLTGSALLGGRLEPMPDGPLGLADGPLFTAGERRALNETLALIAVAGPDDLRDTTLAAWLDQRGPQGRARQFVESLARLATYVEAPDLLSAGAAFSQMRDAALGVVYPDGGWQSIVAGMRQEALARGVRLVGGAPVRSVARRAAGFEVRLDGDVLTAGSVVLAVDPASVRRLLGGESAAFDLPQPRQAVRLAALDLGLARLPRPDAAFLLSLDRPLYLSTHSEAARLAPPGGAAVSVARYLRPGADPDLHSTLRELEALMDLAQPGWRELELARQYLPSITITHSLPNRHAGALPGRAAPAVASSPGLFLAGEWVGDEGQLAATALASGIHAGEMAASSLDATPAAPLVVR